MTHPASKGDDGKLHFNHESAPSHVSTKTGDLVGTGWWYRIWRGKRQDHWGTAVAGPLGGSSPDPMGRIAILGTLAAAFLILSATGAGWLLLLISVSGCGRYAVYPGENSGKRWRPPWPAT